MGRRLDRRVVEHIQRRSLSDDVDVELEQPVPQPLPPPPLQVPPGVQASHNLVLQAIRVEGWGLSLQIPSALGGLAATGGGVAQMSSQGNAAFAAIVMGLSLFVSGFWWRCLHDAAGAHLRGQAATLNEAQQQNIALAQIGEQLRRG